MKLTLYSNKSDYNVINKDLEVVGVVDINLRRGVDITEPTIKLVVDKSIDLSKVNYCHIDVLNRFYYVQDVVSVNNSVVSLACAVDTLETYKDVILSNPSTHYKKVETGDFGDVSITSTGDSRVVNLRSETGLQSNNTVVLSVMNFNSNNG